MGLMWWGRWMGLWSAELSPVSRAEMVTLQGWREVQLLQCLGSQVKVVLQWCAVEIERLLPLCW